VRAATYPITLSDARHLAEHNWLARQMPAGLVTPGPTDSLFDLVAEMDNEVVVPPGTWTISETLEITGNKWIRAADHTSEIVYTGTGSAILLDVPSYSVNRIPRLTHARLWDDTPSGDDTSIGVQVRNAGASIFTVGYIYGFNVGLDVHGDADGCVLNTFHLTTISDCKIGLRWSAANGGWSNQNTYIGGNIAMSTSAAAGVSGSRLIAGVNGEGNGNTLIGVGLEGDRAEHPVELTAGFNQFVGCRFEGTNDILLTGSGARFNVVQGGYGVMALEGYGVNMVYDDATWGPTNVLITPDGSGRRAPIAAS
jgi:hypothetical protein